MKTSINEPTLLSDVDVARFIVNGYHITKPEYEKGLNELIAKQLDDLCENPGDAIIEAIPELRQVLEDCIVRGVLISLLGKDYEVNPHRHWHCRTNGTGSMSWHQDSTNTRSTELGCLLALYYPRTVTADMGPTIIVPGTQFRNAPTDRMVTYTNIRGQVPLVVKAGTVAFTHYDIWHGTAANNSGSDRHMIKFLFNRRSTNSSPTWSHDPEMLTKPKDWNARSGEDVNNILSFSNPLNVSQSDHYKEQRIRQECWNHLMGTNAVGGKQTT